jgi:hypothetical protein
MKEAKKEVKEENLDQSLRFLGLHSRILSHLYRTRAILKLALDYAGSHPPKDESVDLDWFSVLDNLEEENKTALDEMEQIESFVQQLQETKGRQS